MTKTYFEIIFYYRKDSDPRLESLAKISNGQTFFVKDESSSSNSVSRLTDINGVLMEGTANYQTNEQAIMVRNTKILDKSTNFYTCWHFKRFQKMNLKV